MAAWCCFIREKSIIHRQTAGHSLGIGLERFSGGSPANDAVGPKGTPKV